MDHDIVINNRLPTNVHAISEDLVYDLGDNI